MASKLFSRSVADSDHCSSTSKRRRRRTRRLVARISVKHLRRAGWRSCGKLAMSLTKSAVAELLSSFLLVLQRAGASHHSS
mmetsp:Transcript_28593/g.72430  ORF Transcript_28593/g.72430 Transcript_28593/m.72430 type:complete len:81 (+) Transcript_28593:3-245(+)